MDIGQRQSAGHIPGPAPKSSPPAAPHVLAAIDRSAMPAAAATTARSAAPSASASACGLARAGGLRRTPVGAVYCRRPPPSRAGSAV